MRLAGLGNQYVAEQAPWAKLEDDRERAGTILYVALRVVDSLKTLLAPFLPFSAQRLHELLGYDDVIAGAARVPRPWTRTAPGTSCSRATTESWAGRWEASALPPGSRSVNRHRSSRSSTPSEVVAEELARMEAARPSD